MTKQQEHIMMHGLKDLWYNCFLGLKALIYVLVIMLLVLGIMLIFTGLILPGILLVSLNIMIFLLLRWLDHRADDQFEREFDEMVRRNKGE